MKVVIIEDEELSAIKLQNLLLQIDSNIEIVSTIDSVKEATTFLSSNNDIDLIFMDIELVDGNGFQILENTKTIIPIIFITAYNNYAIDAFKYTSVDYLLKPIDRQDLSNSILKYKSIFSENKKPNNQLELIDFFNKKKSRILAIRGKNKYPILISNIAYFYIEDKIVWLIKNDGSKYYINKKLETLETEMDQSIFFRSNRKTLVSITSIIKIETLNKARVKLNLNPSPPFEVIVSSENSAKFKNWIVNN